MTANDPHRKVHKMPLGKEVVPVHDCLTGEHVADAEITTSIVSVGGGSKASKGSHAAYGRGYDKIDWGSSPSIN